MSLASQKREPWATVGGIGFQNNEPSPISYVDGYTFYLMALFGTTRRPIACRRCRRELSLRGLLLHWRAHHTFGLRRPR